MAKTLTSPTSATVDLDTGCSRLWFGPDSLAPSGVYQMAGGICWPLLVRDVFQGVAILAGRHVATQVIYLFDQREFTTIEHVMSGDGNIQSHGLAEWFVSNWATYYAHRYYWFQHDEYNALFRLRVHRSPIIEPKPIFIPVHWGDDAHPSLVISDALEQKCLKIRGGSPVQHQLAQQQADEKQGPFPALHALACLLTGIGRRRLPDAVATDRREPA